MKVLKMLTICAIAFAMLPAAAQAQGTATFSLGAGPSFPVGELGDEANTGFHVVGSLGLTPAFFPLGLRADAQWQQFPDKTSGNFREFGAIGNVIVGVPAAVIRPYLIAGAGVMNRKEPETAHAGHTHAGESSTNFAYGLGGGIRFGLGALSAYAELRYLNTGDNHASIPLTFGVSF